MNLERLMKSPKGEGMKKQKSATTRQSHRAYVPREEHSGHIVARAASFGFYTILRGVVLLGKALLGTAVLYALLFMAAYYD